MKLTEADISKLRNILGESCAAKLAHAIGVDGKAKPKGKPKK